MYWLTELRQKKGITQKTVARLANITQPAYCNIENGRKCPSVETAQKIAKVLGFPWTKFFETGGGDDDVKTKE